MSVSAVEILPIVSVDLKGKCASIIKHNDQVTLLATEISALSTLEGNNYYCTR